MMYWIHRTFHRPALWKYHAVHHSSEDLDWISAARFHPVNIFLGSVATDVVLLLAGISPNVLVFLGPFTIAHSAFVHANLNWTLGPFRYVLAGPVFHRWHHTAAEQGGEKNFASTFPVLDLLFGTYLHAGERRCPTPMGSPTAAFRRVSARRCSIRSGSDSVASRPASRRLQFVHHFASQLDDRCLPIRRPPVG